MEGGERAGRRRGEGVALSRISEAKRDTYTNNLVVGGRVSTRKEMSIAGRCPLSVRELHEKSNESVEQLMPGNATIS